MSIPFWLIFVSPTLLGMLFGVLGEILMRPEANATDNPTRESSKRLVFFESNLFLVPVGLIGGLVGVFFYTPVCAVCVVCVLLGLHRSGAVADKSPSKEVGWYVVVGVITIGTLIIVGIALQNKAGQYARDLAKQIAEYIKTASGGFRTRAGVVR